MIIIPAVDIRGGNCVMLTQGKIDAETIYSKDPVFIAKLWQAKGAKRLHVVDLDGAFMGMPKNLEIVRKIRAGVDIPIEFGGGIRNLKTIDTLIEAGIDYVIVGTLAIYNPDVLRQAVDKYGKKMIGAVDARDDKVAIGGWKDTTSVGTAEVIRKMKDMGIREIIYTDISRDGTLQGPNLDGIAAVARTSKMKVIASGGVSNIEDILNIKALEPDGVAGVVVGKALYTEGLKLEEAIKVAEQAH